MKNLPKLLVILVLICPAALAVPKYSTAADPGAPLAADPIVISVANASTDGQCHVDCRPCYFSTETIVVGNGNGQWEDSYSCAPLAFINCPNPLTRCGPGEGEENQQDADAETVWQVVVAGNLHSIRHMLGYANVELNLARGAIQVTGCDDAVIAHIPLGPAEMALLSEVAS
jgi:hypothetical protein